MKFRPKPYQPKMIDWMLDHEKSAAFAGMGLGKTVCTLSVIDELICSGQSTGAIVVAPLRVAALTWPAQIAKWDHSKWLRVAMLRTPEGMKAWDEGSADIYLANPEQLASYDITRNGKTTRRIGLAERMFKKRTSVPADLFVWDELSLAKGHSTKAVNSIRPYLKQHFPRRIGLTGTPIPNSYLDLFAQVRLLDDGERLGVSFTAYRDRWFMQADYMGYSYKLRPGAKEEIDRKIADLALVMLSEDYLDVPKTFVEDINVSLPTEARKHYKTLEKELLLLLERKEVVRELEIRGESGEAEVEALTASTLYGKLRQIVGGAVYDTDRDGHVLHTAKIDALVKLRKQLGKEPLLILCEYHHEYARILAAIPGAEMFDEKRMDEWRAGRIHTVCANAKSLSHGIDGLQDSCRNLCWFTLPDSNERYLQANARIVRTGQGFETYIWRIIAAGTVDDAVVERLREKDDTQSDFLKTLKYLQKLKDSI